jgi:hypothetical protein
MSTDSFHELSKTVGISLPPTLARWHDSGLTRYENWKETWRERMLNSPPALISAYDFEWIDADQSREVIAEWLNPERQNGMRFLPFAESGAGDSYCLIPVSGETLAVAFIWRHDFSGTLDWLGRSFDEFVYLRMIKTCADFSHLMNDRFTQEDAHRCLLADLTTMVKSLPQSFAERLQPMMSRPVVVREDRKFGQVRQIPGLMSNQELEEEFSFTGLPPLDIVEPASPNVFTDPFPPPPSWQELANDPSNKLAAIRLYQTQHGVGMGAAKQVVDAYIADRSSRS